MLIVYRAFNNYDRYEAGGCLQEQVPDERADTENIQVL